MFQDTLGMRLRSAYLTFHRLANAHFEPLGVTADQFVILTLLAEGEGMTQRDLVDRACSDPNTVGEMLARLEKKGLIQRERHPSDGRARCVSLTTSGRELQRELRQSWEVCVCEIEAQFTSEDLAVLGALLERFPGVVASVRDRRSAAPPGPANDGDVPTPLRHGKTLNRGQGNTST